MVARGRDPCRALFGRLGQMPALYLAQGALDRDGRGDAGWFGWRYGIGGQARRLAADSVFERHRPLVKDLGRFGSTETQKPSMGTVSPAPNALRKASLRVQQAKKARS